MSFSISGSFLHPADIDERGAKFYRSLFSIISKFPNFKESSVLLEHKFSRAPKLDLLLPKCKPHSLSFQRLPCIGASLCYLPPRSNVIRLVPTLPTDDRPQHSWCRGMMRPIHDSDLKDSSHLANFSDSEQSQKSTFIVNSRPSTDFD